MDSLEKLRQIIIETLRYYANLRYATEEVNRLLVVDKDSDNYLTSIPTGRFQSRG